MLVKLLPSWLALLLPLQRRIVSSGCCVAPHQVQTEFRSLLLPGPVRHIQKVRVVVGAGTGRLTRVVELWEDASWDFMVAEETLLVVIDVAEVLFKLLDSLIGLINFLLLFMVVQLDAIRGGPPAIICIGNHFVLKGQFTHV